MRKFFGFFQNRATFWKSLRLSLCARRKKLRTEDGKIHSSGGGSAPEARCRHPKRKEKEQ